MKKSYFTVTKFISRLCSLGIALLGFTACDEHEDMYGTPLMYGCPTGSFSVSGTVTSEDGMPVGDAQVRVVRAPLPSGLYAIDEDTTTPDGVYKLSGYCDPYSLKVVCIPSGNELEADSVTVAAKFKDDGQHKDNQWYEGHADLTVDFKLKKKEK